MPTLALWGFLFKALNRSSEVSFPFSSVWTCISYEGVIITQRALRKWKRELQKVLSSTLLYIFISYHFQSPSAFKFPFSLPQSQSHCPVAPPTAQHTSADLAVCPHHSLSCHAQGYAADSYGSLQPGTGWHTLMNDAALTITELSR